MDTAAIIVAAGRGRRAAAKVGERPKQYRLLAGQMVLTRSLRVFAEHPVIDHIVAIIHDDDRALYDEAVAALPAERLLPPVAGGDTRQLSVLAGLRSLQAVQPRRVLIHDAARPLVSAAVIDRVLAALEHHSGALAAVPLADTLKRADGDVTDGTAPREGLWQAQTPQGFHYPAILTAHESALANEWTAFTDDAALAEWQGFSVALVRGARDNVKLTEPEDFAMAERMLAGGEEFRSGSGFDVHGFAPGDHVVLCGVRIAHDRRLAGHSDADVGLHALTDALLGAIGAGDIGVHFPPSDMRWQGADSGLFLRHAAELVAKRGGRIVNADVTLICETPKIAPHREAMQARVAELLAVAPGRVSVKATTTEGLGFTGRGEGIAALAAATVAVPRAWPLPSP